MPRRGAWMTRPVAGVDPDDRPRRGAERVANGTALWFPPGTKSLTAREMLAESLPFMPEGFPKLARVGRLDAAMKAHHPKQPHWYLSLLSVEPESQGKGHGSALIQPGLDRADQAKSGAYLETQRERNIGFYEQFGFELVEKLVIDDELPVWLMWRPGLSGTARPATPASDRAAAPRTSTAAQPG